MSERRFAAVSLAFTLMASLPAAAQPVPGFVYPCSIQAGTSGRILVGGMYMRGVNGAVVSGEGVRVKRVTQVPGFPRTPGKTQMPWLYDWLDAILKGDRSDRPLPDEATAEDTDWQVCDWWTNLNLRDRLELELVTRFWMTPENYPQPTPALDQQVILDLEVDRSAKPGLRELMVHDASSISAPHPFFVTVEPHVAEPTFVIPTNGLSKLGVPDLLHLPCNLPVRTPPVVMDGQAWPGETDEFRLLLRKGVRYTFETVARELQPYLGDAVPGFFNPAVELFGPDGRLVASEDDFYYLPDPILSCVPNADGVHVFKIHDNLYRGRADFVYTVRCYEDAPRGHSYTPQERAFACFPPPASHRPPEAGEGVDVRQGTIDCPGRIARHRFTVGEPQTMSFELFARRMGSPLEGVLRLYGPLGPEGSVAGAPLLAEWDDLDKFLAGTVPQAISDPCGSWTFLDPGDYCLTVADSSRQGGAPYQYTLVLSRHLPDVAIHARQSAFLMRGRAVTVPVHVERLNGLAGEVEIEIEENDLFAGGARLMPDPKGEGSFTIQLKGEAVKGLATARLFARITVGNRTFRREITPADPAEQAFAYTHLVPQRAFFFYGPQPERRN